MVLGYSVPSRISFGVRHTDALVIYLFTILGSVRCYYYIFLFYIFSMFLIFLSKRDYMFFFVCWLLYSCCVGLKVTLLNI